MNSNYKVKIEIYLILKKLIIKENAIKSMIRKFFDKDQIREENEPLNTYISNEISYTCIPNKSYIVLGDLEGLF
ncbi:fatty acid synthase-like [Vespula maculifrons]|uniref:Fatty acid synthase-like n=1 Tax=Vespula maculifrons TaxID=7453 RepID=A0ABD2CUF2_VESMC